MTDEKEETKSSKGVSRREFIAGTVGGVVAGAAVTAAAGSLGLPRTVQADTQTAHKTRSLAQASSAYGGASAIPTTWDMEADVVIIGAGGAGLPAALAANAKGASVIVVDMNYDVGGHAVTSGGTVDLGGGTVAQQKFNVADSADLVFQDLTSPVATNWTTNGTKYQDRALSRVLADNEVACFNFLVANGIQFSDNVPSSTTAPSTSHWISVSGTARSNVPMWKGSTSPAIGPDNPANSGGVGYARPLEATARSNGVQFLLNYQMTTIYRDYQYSGRVVGITANYTGGRIMPGSTTPLQPYCTLSGSLVPNVGNIISTQATVNIKANKGVIVATGGCSSNVDRRKRYDPRLTDVYQTPGDPFSFQTGDGEVAAQKIGASLYATGNATAHTGAELTKGTRLGTQYYSAFTPASPLWPITRATGLVISNLQDIIDVNMAGVRFADETATSLTPAITGASTDPYMWLDAAMATNANSSGPDWSGGPIWAIFDSAAVTREKWTVGPPNTDPAYFYQANDIPTLVLQINTHKYQTTPMNSTALQNTITRYNGFVDSGTDSDFGKPKPLYKINTPPYYAANHTPWVHDCLTGLRIDGGAHVLDFDAVAIPGLYAAGESAGGFCHHGLGKCSTFGMIAGNNAATGT